MVQNGQRSFSRRVVVRIDGRDAVYDSGTGVWSHPSPALQRMLRDAHAWYRPENDVADHVLREAQHMARLFGGRVTDAGERPNLPGRLQKNPHPVV